MVIILEYRSSVDIVYKFKSSKINTKRKIFRIYNLLTRPKPGKMTSIVLKRVSHWKYYREKYTRFEEKQERSRWMQKKLFSELSKRRCAPDSVEMKFPAGFFLRFPVNFVKGIKWYRIETVVQIIIPFSS